MTKKFSLLGVLALALSMPSFGAESCANISCDCDSLPSDAWKSVCTRKQTSLVEQCQQTQGIDFGYCSIHGPAATRLPLALNLETTEEQSNSIKLLNYKFAAVYWSMYKDLDFIEAKVDTEQYAMADQRLNVLQANTEHLFNIQKQVVKLLEESANDSEIEKSWRSYSEDTASVTEKLLAYGDKLMVSASQSGDEKAARALASRIVGSAGDLYEQVGYSYSQGARHKLAAEAWKQSANISSLLLSMAEKAGDADDIKYYRYQAATRLHRASYNWAIGIEDENARKALAESQIYMDDSSQLDSLVNNSMATTRY